MTRIAAFLAALTLAASAAAADPLPLTPASPQPAGLSSGLSVIYAYPGSDIKSLADATAALNAAPKAGKPLTGLDYSDTSPGQVTLTSDRVENVAARITGYVKFDAAGSYDIEFLTNDGLDARIGGQRVGHFDGRQACGSTRVIEVSVPEPGWYPVDILYFQRLGTSCLHMKWGPLDGKRTWTPDEVFGRK